MLKLLIVGFDVVIVTEVHGDDDVTIPKTVHFEDESETSEDVREYRIHRKSGQKLLPVKTTSGDGHSKLLIYSTCSAQLHKFNVRLPIEDFSTL